MMMHPFILKGMSVCHINVLHSWALTNSPSGSLLLNAGSSLRITSTMDNCIPFHLPCLRPFRWFVSHLLALHQHHPTSAFIFGEILIWCFQKTKKTHIPSEALQPATASRPTRPCGDLFESAADSWQLGSSAEAWGDDLSPPAWQAGPGRQMCVVGLVVSSVFWCSICFKA